MARGFKFDISDWKKATRAAQKVVPKKIIKRRNQFLVGASASLAAGVGDEAPVFTGQLHNAFGSEVENMEKQRGARGIVYVEGPAARYAEVVNDGREPGTFPNLTAIRRYVDLKIKRGEMQVDVATLFPGRKKPPTHNQIVNALAFLIGRKIQREGTTPNKYIDRGIKTRENDVNRMLDKVTNMLLKDIGVAMAR